MAIEVTRANEGLFLSQRTYTSDLLKRTKMDSSKAISNPMAATSKLSRFVAEPFMDPSTYRSTVGALQYLTITRQDLAFSVNKVCQFMSSPMQDHRVAIKHILRYLKSIMTFGILLRPSSTFHLVPSLMLIRPGAQ